MSSSYLTTASGDAIDDTQRRKFLKQNVYKLSEQLVAKNRKIKVMQ